MYNQHQQWGYGGGGPPMQPYFPPFPPGGGGGPNHFYGGGVPPYPHYEEGGGPPYPHFGGVEGANFGGEGPSHFGGGGGGPRFGPRGPMGGGPRFTADGRPWAEDPPHYVFPGKHASPFKRNIGNVLSRIASYFGILVFHADLKFLCPMA
jgi:hypothetical protein